jgi:hypothetical protein
LSRFLRMCNQSLQKVQIRVKKIFVLKNSIWVPVSKNAEFHADFESVEKVLKKYAKKKFIIKNVENIHHFKIGTVKMLIVNHLAFMNVVLRQRQVGSHIFFSS